MSRQKAANIFEALNFIELEMKCFPSYAASLGRVSPEALKKFVVNVPTCEVPKNQDRIKLAEESWKRFLKGDQKITYLDLRYICWLPRISTTIELVKFVNKEKIVLRDRELRGLLFGGLTEYDRVKNDLVWRKEVRNIFDKSNERQRQLWNELELYCLRSEGLGVSILDMLKRRETPKDFIRRKFGLTVENGQFINLLSRELCTHGKELLLDPPREQRQWAYEKILKNAVQSDKLSAIESALTSMSDRTSVEAKQDLKKFLLDDPFLGDPRLKSGNWIAASDFLKKRIIEWFSSEDIRFFFESIFQAHLDTQGRKKFWMRYGSVVKRTRVLLNDSDRRQFQHLLVREGYESSPVIGRIDDSGRQGSGSVFLIDFGDVIVAEFSVPNNSCWVFTKNTENQINREIWEDSVFWKKIFTRTEFRLAQDSWRHASGWETRFSNKLAQFGVRPRGYHDY